MKYELVAQRLTTAMKHNHLQVADLAKQSGLTINTIYCYIGGRHTPSYKSARALGRVLHVNPAWILGLSDKEQEDTGPIIVAEHEDGNMVSSVLPCPCCGMIPRVRQVVWMRGISEGGPIPENTVLVGEIRGMNGQQYLEWEEYGYTVACETEDCKLFGATSKCLTEQEARRLWNERAMLAQINKMMG